MKLLPNIQAVSPRNAFRNLRDIYQSFVAEKSRFILRLLGATLILAIACFVIELVSPSLRNDEMPDSSILQQDVARTKLYVHSVANRLSMDREKIATDSVIVGLLKDHSTQRQLFQRLLRIVTPQESRGPGTEAPLAASNVFSIYDTSRSLIAWTDTPPLSTYIDTVLTSPHFPLEKSKVLYLDRGQISTRLISFQKIFDEKNATIGYVVGQRLVQLDLSDVFGIANGLKYSVLGEIGLTLPRSFSLDLTASRIRPYFDAHHGQTNIFADSTEPQSYLGVLTVRPSLQSDQDSATPGIVSIIRDLSVVLFLLFLQLLLVSHLFFGETSPFATSSLSFRLEMLVGLLLLFRVLLWLTSAGYVVLAPNIRDSSIYGFSGLPFFTNPYELFISALSALLFAIAFYRIVFENRTYIQSGEGKIERRVTQVSKTMLPFVIGGGVIFCLSLLWSLLVEMIITNGNFSFIFAGTTFPVGAELCALLALLFFSASYLLLLIGVILFLVIRYTRILQQFSSEGDQRLRRYYFLFPVLLLMLLSVPLAIITGATLVYWVFHLGIAGIFTEIVIFINITVTSESEVASSNDKIRQLSRSPILILSVLSMSALFIAPRIIDLEYAKLKLDTEQDILSRTSFQLNSLAPTLESSLADVQSNTLFTLPDTGTAKQDIPFLLWLYLKKNFPNTRIVTSLFNRQGTFLSGYGAVHFFSKLDKGQKNVDSANTHFLAEYIKQYPDTGISTPSVHQSDDIPNASLPIFIGITALHKKDALTNHDSTIFLVVNAKKELFAESGQLFNDPRIRIFLRSNDNVYSLQDRNVLSIYKDNTLLQSGRPDYVLPPQFSASEIARANSENGLWVSTFMHGETLETYVKGFVHDDVPSYFDNALLAATIKPYQLSDYGSIFLFINAIGLGASLILIGFVISLRLLFYGKAKLRFRFRDRLFIIVLALAIIPLVLVTNVTSSILYENGSREQTDRSIDQTNSISEKLTSLIDAGAPSERLQEEIADFAMVTSKHIDLYSPTGILRIADNYTLYQSLFITPQLPTDAIVELFINKKDIFSTTRDLDDEKKYVVTYKQIKDTHGGINGIVAVADADQRKILNADISRTVRSIYGVFSFVSFILLLFGSYISHKFASPIYKLISATVRVASGELGTSVEIDRQDEIGELSTAFNRMSAELANSRDRVAQSEREGAWKEMARQVAHEIKNPLTPMKLSVQHMEHAFEKGEENFPSIFKRVIRTLSEQIDVLTRIATEFARFGEMPRRKYTFTSLRRIADSAVALFDSERSHIRFVIDIPELMSPIYADEEEFRRTLVNLIRNSIQAIDEWGTILLTAEEKAGIVHLSITDTGGGMSEETLKKAFDPNFSTKTSGMGLGLAIVKRTITDMSGTISVTSEHGKGTTFHIDLPAKEK